LYSIHCRCDAVPTPHTFRKWYFHRSHEYPGSGVGWCSYKNLRNTHFIFNLPLSSFFSYDYDYYFSATFALLSVVCVSRICYVFVLGANCAGRTKRRWKLRNQKKNRHIIFYTRTWKSPVVGTADGVMTSCDWKDYLWFQPAMSRIVAYSKYIILYSGSRIRSKQTTLATNIKKKRLENRIAWRDTVNL